jgi:hypothetical protein
MRWLAGVTSRVVAEQRKADPIGVRPRCLQERHQRARRARRELNTGIPQHRQAEQDAPDKIVTGRGQALAQAHQSSCLFEKGSPVLLSTCPRDPEHGRCGARKERR